MKTLDQTLQDLLGAPSDPLTKDVAEFATHLAHERRASPRTVEHYVRDLMTLVEFARKYSDGAPTLNSVSLAVLRGWLGSRWLGCASR